MTTPAVRPQPRSYIDRPSPSGLAEVLELILDKGLVIDIYVRISLVGIELLTIDARIVVASVDTYLRFAEAVNRLDLTQTQTHRLPELMDDLREGGARSKTKGALQGVKEKLGETLNARNGADGAQENEEAELRPREQRYRRGGP